MTRAEADAIFAAQEAKRQAGLCVIPDCQNLNEGRTLDRCREHGGVARPVGMGIVQPHVTPQHRQGLHTGWYSRES